MKNLNLSSKLCDAADWFRPEVPEIINCELRETPRFHRKQWEFAMIFLALRQRGLLKSDKVGLSMGGGRERLLYALAQHIKQLVVTDIYASQTSWDCARTNDPETFIRSNKPFPVDDTKFKVLRMDMRDLQFPDQTFDFCYSSCAIEHIGTHTDFLRHLNEVARVLKDDGIYVMTTEVQYGDITIHDQNNYIFSPDYLTELLSESDLVPAEECDARIMQHAINFPKPSNIASLCWSRFGHISSRLLDEGSHVQLLRGKHPFSSGLFVLCRKDRGAGKRRLAFNGMESSCEFMESGVAQYRHVVENSTITLDPFSLLPNGLSTRFSDHTEFSVTRGHNGEDKETVFHTDYFWLGSGGRTFEVSLCCAENAEDGSEIDLRLHRYRTLSSSDVQCVAQCCMQLVSRSRLVWTLGAHIDDEYCYAVLAKVKRGNPVFENIEVRSFPSSSPDFCLNGTATVVDTMSKHL
jgi:SAM-dependent methyltransferase